MTNQNHFPNSYFMDWLRANLCNQKIKINLHYKDEKYLSDIISHREFIYETEEDRFRKATYINVQEMKNKNLESTNINNRKWEPQKIIVISAQTGKGKNYFIFNNMLRKLHENFPNENDLILVVSNRIATSRQNKKQIAELLVELIATDEYKRKIQKIYFSMGIDEHCIDFGVISICTYHQLLNRQLLRDKKFRYIILDECHFFTSDATFNPETNNILKEIVTYGKDSIRVYMSATPEVAFEAIIREEYSMVQNRVQEKIKPMIEANNNREEKLNNVFNSGELFILENSISCHENNQHKSEIYKMIREHNLSILPFPEQEIKKIEDETFLEIEFYYMPRHYDYIEQITPYKTADELLKHIKTSEGKWIIFVHSEKNGKELEKELIKSQIVSKDDCILISRPEIELESKEMTEYDYIINNEMSSKRILISTCVLDNGINIKNPIDESKKHKVLNVAVSSYDRTQFIQMLGRVRDNQTDKIKLFIKEFSIDDLKRNIKRDAEELIYRLANDFYSIKTKKEFFNHKLFYFTDTEEFSQYNPCAIYQLIDQMTRTLRIIRKTDKRFFIPVSEKLKALKEKVYQFYREHYTYCWSRNIIELLNTETHDEEIKNYIVRAKEDNQDWKQYFNKIDDTFTHYLFSDLLPQHFSSIIEKKFKSYYERIPNSTGRNLYKVTVEEELHTEHVNSESSYYNKAIYLQKQCQLLKEMFSDTFIDISLNFIEEYAEKVKYYEDLADDKKFSSFYEEQLRWIEKSAGSYSTVSETQPADNNSYDDISKIVQSKAITDEELQKNIHKKKDGTDSAYHEDSFLNKHGIVKNSEVAKKIAQEYFNSQPLTNCINKKFSIEGKTYILKSANSNTSRHPTYYLFIEAE